MGPARRRPIHSVITQLQKDPHKFRFFQAVRLLQSKTREGGDAGAPRNHEVGYHRDPRDERLRFEGNASLRFPSCEILAVKPIELDDEDAWSRRERRSSAGRNNGGEATDPQIESPTELQKGPQKGPQKEPQKEPLADRYSMKVNFLGLYGATGIMPQFDTQRLINSGPRENVEKAFLDLFNHRAISLFYRIWEKHRFYIGYERVRAVHRDEGSRPDSFTEQLQSVLGLGTRAVQNRLAIRDESLLYYAGHFSRSTRCAVSLERILNDYFSFACEVVQFVGQWLELDASNRSEMPTGERPLGINCTLGQAFILGERVWSRDGKFRVRLGPLSYPEFDRILTQGDEVRALSQVTRMYVGLQYDFDVQLVLDRMAVPKMKMDDPKSLRLGENTWLITRQPPAHVDDSIIEVDGYPEYN